MTLLSINSIPDFITSVLLQLLPYEHPKEQLLLSIKRISGRPLISDIAGVRRTRSNVAVIARNSRGGAQCEIYWLLVVPDKSSQ